MRRIIAGLSLVAVASVAAAQAAPNTTLALIGYNSLKARIKPQGELGAQIASLDTLIRAASASGQTAMVRRWIAKGTALMSGRAWADTNDYRQSLVLRSEHLYVDPSQPYGVRLEQTYAPSIDGLANLKAAFTVRAAAAPGSSPQPSNFKLQASVEIARDLRDTPARADLDLTGLADGDYVVEAAVSDSVRALGSARLRITVLSKLAARMAALDVAAAKAPVNVIPDLMYPSDFVHKVERGIVSAGTFDLAAELAAAESTAAESRKPGAESRVRTGGFERHYLLMLDGNAGAEIMPYRVFVPATYDGKKAMPLIIALHGAGGTEDSFMDSYGRLVPQLAEQRGYIVAAPMGFRVDGGYGSPIMGGRAGVNSEADVMQVLARMRRDFKVDDHRIYLMGHSMGAIGTWYIGQKYPEIWAAMGEFSGMGFPATVEKMKAIPQFVVHGDNDNTVNVQRSRDMVAAMQALKMDYKYTEVPGGDHNGVVVPNLAAMFDFFDARRKP